MREDPETDGDAHDSEAEAAEEGTLYFIAAEEMRRLIGVYLRLTQQTKGFASISAADVQGVEERLIVLGGISSSLDAAASSAEEVIQEWERMRAVPFEVELGITGGVYIVLRTRVEELLDEMARATEDYTKFDSAYISANP